MIPDPRFMCRAPLNNNRSRGCPPGVPPGVPPPSDGVVVWLGVVVGNTTASNCLLIYCASGV